MESKHRKASRSLRTDLESLQVESKHRHAQTIDSRDIEALDLLTVKRFNKAPRKDFLNTDERPNRAAVTSAQIVATADSVRTLSEAHVKRILGGTKIRPCVLGSLQRRWTKIICDLGRCCCDSAKVARRTTIVARDVAAAIAGEAMQYAGYGHLMQPLRSVETKVVD